MLHCVYVRDVVERLNDRGKKSVEQELGVRARLPNTILTIELGKSSSCRARSHLITSSTKRHFLMQRTENRPTQWSTMIMLKVVYKKALGPSHTVNSSGVENSSVVSSSHIPKLQVLIAGKWVPYFFSSSGGSSTLARINRALRELEATGMPHQ